ncbi:MAG: hypothetical protein K2Y35_14610 [Burkholderiales bacterium]|nr:hypothetical protein [Burkholderiales bacterium]
MRHRTVVLIATASMVSACSTMKFDLGVGSRVATIPQSLLAATPCVQREVEAVFGVTPELVENTDRWHIRLTVTLPGSGKKPPEVRYVLRAIDSSNTRVSYEVEGASGIDQQAFEPIARCAGVRGTKS